MAYDVLCSWVTSADRTDLPCEARMIRIQNVLVATDFSEPSEAAP
jgi:hypothetical protein